MASGLSAYKETSFQECDVCRHHNVSSEAVSYCISCQEFMCPTCAKAHRGSKLTRDHELQSGSNMPAISTTVISKPFIMVCEDHKTKLVNMYCQSHDDVICKMCKVTSHVNCKTTDIFKQAKQMKKDGSFNDTRTQLEDLQSKYGKRKISMIEVKKKNKSALEKCLHDMHHIRKDINKTLHTLEKILQREIQEVDYGFNKEFGNHVTFYEDALAIISDQLKLMKEYEKSQDAEVMFVGMKRASTIQSTYEDTMNQIEEELDQPEMTFRINDILYDVKKQLQTVDTVLIENRSLSLKDTRLYFKQDISSGFPYERQNLRSLVNTSLSGRREIDVGATCVSGCAFMPGGYLVTCCGPEGVRLLDKNFNVISQLDKHVYQVAVYNYNEVIVTGDSNKIHRVTLLPKMEVTNTMETDTECWGIDVSGDEIYVTCFDAPGNGEVHVLNMAGVLQRKLGVDNGNSVFTCPNYVKVNESGSRVFVSDAFTHNVTCLDEQGRVIYQYADTELKFPSGMYVDYEGSLVVCCYDGSNVHVIGHDGRKAKILLSEIDGLEYPMCTAIRQTDACLVMGIYACNKKSLISFTAQ